MQNISDFLSEDEMSSIAEEVKNAAYEIIKKKGATYYGIGMTLVKITNAILGNENSVMVVSSYDEENDIYIGLPSVINANGAERKIYFKLNEEETNKLRNSINVIKENIDKMEF